MTITLVCLLGAILALSIVAMNADVASPAPIFILGFFLCSIGAAVGRHVWGGDLTEQVVFVLVLGTLVFLATCVLVRIYINSLLGVPVHDDLSKSELVWFARSNTIALVLFLIFQLVTIIITMKAIAAAYPSSSLFESIAAYDKVRKFSTAQLVQLPKIVSIAAGLCGGISRLSSMVLGFAIARGNRKLMVMAGANLLAGIALSFNSGGRNALAIYIFYVIISYLIASRLFGQISASFYFKIGVVTVLITTLFLLMFQVSLALVGRSSDHTFVHYIVIYIGAQIYNLDAFLQEGNVWATQSAGHMTFIESLNWITLHFNSGESRLPLDLPFMARNGLGLGNVYTTFYAFVYDFGIKGVVILTTLMALVSQVFYEVTKRQVVNIHYPCFLVVYLFIAGSLLLSFFSNKFYEDVLSLTAIRSLVYSVAAIYAYMVVSLNSERVKRVSEMLFKRLFFGGIGRVR